MLKLYLDGRHVFQPADFRERAQLKEDIVAWCNENIAGGWEFKTYYHLNHIEFMMWFTVEKDRLYFNMMWL